MEKEYRVREVALRKDGKETWYYPEALIETKSKKGMLWWKKEVVNQEWKPFYTTNRSSDGEPFSFEEYWDERRNAWRDDPKPICFDTLRASEEWIAKRVERLKLKEENLKQSYLKELGSFATEAKTHKVRTN